MDRFERRTEPLLPPRAFYLRVLRSAAVSAAVIGTALSIGVGGYHFIAGLPWIDALLNASMILAGMGPVDALNGAASKLFASAYALFSGVVFLGVAGVIFAPFYHRLIHHFHLQIDGADDEQAAAPKRSRRR